MTDYVAKRDDTLREMHRVIFVTFNRMDLDTSGDLLEVINRFNSLVNDLKVIQAQWEHEESL